MRLTLSILYIGLMLAALSTILIDAIAQQEARSQTAADRIGTEFIWPDDSAVAEPEAALSILTEAAEATDANVLRTSVGTAASGQKRITHYVYMSQNRTGLFDQFDLAEGRWLNRAESQDGSATVSSARTDEGSNVGVPEVFGDRYELAFASLDHAFDSLPSAGRYVVEAPDGASERFLDIVVRRLAEAGVAESRIEDLTPGQDLGAARADSRLNIPAYVLAGTATLVAAFILLRQGKRIGVLRLMGHSSPRIWYSVVGRLPLLLMFIGISAYAVLSFTVAGVDALLTRPFAIAMTELMIIGFAATLGVGLVVIHRVQVADLIKGNLQ